METDSSGAEVTVDTAGRSQKKIEEYIRSQLSGDKLSDELRTKEVYGPFTAEAVVIKGKNKPF